METGELQQVPRRRRIEDVLVVSNKAAARSILERGLSDGDLSVLDHFVATDVVAFDSALPEPLVGLDAYRQSLVEYRTAFPDLRLGIVELAGENDLVFARWMASGTHQGELFGIAATGKSSSGIAGMTSFRFANGKVVEERTTWDALGLMQQLGVAPPLTQGAALSADDAERAVREAMQQLTDVFNAKDARRFASLFAEDATVINPMGKLAVGREQIVRVVGEDMSSFLQDATVKFQLLRMHTLRPGYVFVDAENEITGGPARDTSDGTMRLHIALLGKWVGERWLWLEARPHVYLSP